jgi:Na+-translocating ferredoxin:NAD+ oxidoreductase subunit B
VAGHGQRLAGVAEGAQRSNYRAVIDAESCTACGACIKRCPVDAISEDPHHPKPHIVKIHRAGVEPERVPRASVVDPDKCIGCGVCVIGCPEDSIVMEPVSEEEWFHVPSSMTEWEEMRLEYLAAATTAGNI